MLRRTAALALVVLLLPGVALPEVPKEEDAGFLFALAQVYRFQGRFEEAFEAFSQAARMAPEDPFLHLEFGEFLFQIGRLGEAVEQVETARSAAPTNREALRLLGRIRLRESERSPESLDRARDIFEQLRAMDPLDVDVRVTLGRLYLSRGEPRAAASVLREARDLRQRDRLIASLLVDGLSALSDSDPEVLEELRGLVEQDPSFLQARLALSQALARRDDHAAVVELLEEAPAKVRGNVEYLRLLSFSYYRTGDFSKSLESGEKWLERRPEDPAARYLRALTLAAVGQNDEAESILRDLVQEASSRDEMVFALAEIVERQGRRSEAAEMLRSAIDDLGQQGERSRAREATVILADLLARDGKWQEVLALSDEAVKNEDPLRDAGFELLRVRALQELGQLDDALAALTRLEGREGFERRVAARRAEILLLAGRTQEAEALMKRFTNSDQVADLMLAAEVFHAAELFSRALPSVRQAERLAPDNLEVLFWLGATFERSSQIEDADRVFRRLLAIDENFAPALNYLGYMWADRGERLEEALALIQKAVALEPNNGAYLDSLGWAYFQKGRLEEAREPLERAARVVGNDPIVFEHLGDLYAAIGEGEKAASAYRKALELGGKNAAGIRRKLRGLAGQ